jgi:hypothetical protein
MNSDTTAQSGSTTPPFILLFIGLILVFILVVFVGFDYAVSIWGHPAGQAVDYSTQASPSPKLALAFGGFPDTPTPFQPLPTSTSIPTPAPSPTTPPAVMPALEPTVQLPPSAKIQGIRGYPQTLNLSCE